MTQDARTPNVSGVCRARAKGTVSGGFCNCRGVIREFLRIAATATRQVVRRDKTKVDGSIMLRDN